MDILDGSGFWVCGAAALPEPTGLKLRIVGGDIRHVIGGLLLALTAWWGGRFWA